MTRNSSSRRSSLTGADRNAVMTNVQRTSMMNQLQLLGERPRITDEVARKVSRNHPFLELDWSRLREDVNSRVELFDVRSANVQNLVRLILTWTWSTGRRCWCSQTAPARAENWSPNCDCCVRPSISSSISSSGRYRAIQKASERSGRGVRP